MVIYYYIRVLRNIGTVVVAIDPVGRRLSSEEENTEANLAGKIKRKQNMVGEQKRRRNAEGKVSLHGY